MTGMMTLLLTGLTLGSGDPQAALSNPDDGNGRLKVFLLAGQSNMEGQAVVDFDHPEHYNGGRGNLERVMKESKQPALYRHLKTSAGAWRERDDVSVWYRTGNGLLKKGPLSIGYAVYPGKHHFGPELQFGHVMGDHYKDHVLLLKTAWGGKSLFRDFRPPGAGGETGPFYRKMIAEIHEVLGDLKEHCPGYSGRGYEICGFAWFQGWNDMFDEKAVEEYESNLAHLIRDVRREFKLPKLPVVVGETGNANNEKFRENQAAIAGRREFSATVRFVKTRSFLRPAENSPNVSHGHHWFGNAESYFLIGDAFGKSMKGLVSR